MQTTVHPPSTYCISPRAVENIHVLDSPSFHIVTTSSFACQDSSITLNCEIPPYSQIKYEWTKPVGASFIGGDVHSSTITIQFDSIYNDTVSLYVSDSNWNIKCYSNSQVTIKVVPMPTAHCYINPIICAGDTVNVELTDRSNNAYTFVWDFDFNGTDGIVTSSSGTTGPWGCHWDDGGTKIITVLPVTEEGCLGLPINDTILVRSRPSAWFNHGQGATVCAEDSVLFSADMGDSADYKYIWQPTHYFRENNKGNCWGRVDISGYVSLTVIDPFGCIGVDSLMFETNPSCCIVYIPNAFTPNGDGKDDLFRPLYMGYHNFHIFRVQNRWGQTVFESTNNNLEWDGNYMGVPQDIGVYYYFLEYDCNGQTIIKRGDVTLIR
jgi:gliding motility-associated-like protein